MITSVKVLMVSVMQPFMVSSTSGSDTGPITSLPFDVPTDVFRQVYSNLLYSTRKAKLLHDVLAIFTGHRELEELHR